MGLEELLRVLREEADHEERSLREEAARDAERIRAEAAERAARAREGALAREGRERAARLRAVQEAEGLERERMLLGEARRLLEAVRVEAFARLREEVGPGDVERFTAEVLREAGPVGAILVVDPGMEAAARRAAEALRREPAPEIRTAGEPRGGVELRLGPLVLDDTVAARLERAWPGAEPEIARLLLAEG